MKKLISTLFLILFLFSMIPNAEAKQDTWGCKWKSETRECTVTITYGGGPIPYSISESYSGTKRVCVNGTGLCVWNGSCE